MILSPQSINRHRLGSSSDILAAQLNSLPSINLSCNSHKQLAHSICFHENCPTKILCSKCLSDHPEAHKSNLLPCQEFLGSELIKRIDQEILCNILIEQKNEIYVKFLDQIQIALVEVRKRIDKTLTEIYHNLKEKSLSNCTEPLYPTSEWDKLKKSLIDKKISLAKANLENQKKYFEEYRKVYSIANVALMDAENTKDLKNTIDSKESSNSPEVDPQCVDETIKNLRATLNALCTKISLQITPSLTPEENIQHSPSPYYKKFSLNAPPSPYFGRNPKHKLSQQIEPSPSSGSTIPLVKDKLVLEKCPSTSAGGGDMTRVKSMIPDEILSPTRPPFLYDEYLATEVINLPYVGPIKLDDGTIYRGQMKDGKKHGKGKLVWKDGKFYEGYFKDDHVEGKGRMVHADQDIYEGEWKNGKAHGKGKYEKADGWVYEGEWVNDEIHGKGIELWPDRSTYDGEYQNGSKNGKGTLIGPDGSCYSGEFKDNVFHGEGKYIWIDGRKYEGTWVKNRREGKGVMYYPDGKKYNGEFLNDKKNGFGRFDWGDGRKYVGYWKEGKQHGQGKLYTKSGDIIDGEWKEGKLVENIAAAINEAKSIKNLEIAKEKVELSLKRIRSRNPSLEKQIINPQFLAPISSKEITDSFRQKIREPEERVRSDKENKEKGEIIKGISLFNRENSRERRSSIEANM